MVALLAEGRDLAFLVEGDASTLFHLRPPRRAVRELAPGVEVDTIPGVSSFAAAAAVAGLALAEEDETMAVIPAAYGTTVIDHLLDEFDTLVLMKVKPLLDEVLDCSSARPARHELLLSRRWARRAARGVTTRLPACARRRSITSPAAGAEPQRARRAPRVLRKRAQVEPQATAGPPRTPEAPPRTLASPRGHGPFLRFRTMPSPPLQPLPFP